jgi:hypothetical protein
MVTSLKLNLICSVHAPEAALDNILVSFFIINFQILFKMINFILHPAFHPSIKSVSFVCQKKFFKYL